MSDPVPPGEDQPADPSVPGAAPLTPTVPEASSLGSETGERQREADREAEQGDGG